MAKWPNKIGFDLKSGLNEVYLDKLVFRQLFLFSLMNQKFGDWNNINT